MNEESARTRLFNSVPPIGALFGRPAPFPRRVRAYGQFKLASAVIILASMAVLGPWVEWRITNREINTAAKTVAEYLETIIGPELQGLEHETSLSPELTERLNALAKKTVLGKTFAALKIRDRGGRILYSSSAPSMTGLVFPDDPKLIRAWHDEVAAGISKLDEPENAGERPLAPQLMEVYVPIHKTGSSQIITVAEFFLRSDDLQEEIRRARLWTWSAFAASVFIVFLILARLFRRADLTIEKQAGQLQNQVSQLTEVLARNAELDKRISQAASTVVTLHERLLKRIGSELHDGPLQDQSFVAMRLDNVVARSERCILNCQEGKTCNDELQVIQDSLEHGLKEVRAISSGLGVPGLAELKLPLTLKRAARDHERRTGTTVALELDGVPEQISLPAKITLYRLVQEALTNSFRHAGGIGQEIHARREADEVVVEISDRGPGFDVAAVQELKNSFGEHLGLLGMRERLESLGGSFSIESKPGQGTRITARLSVDAGKTSND